MTRSPLYDAFAHHVWATVTLIDTCLDLSEEQLATNVPGTYGSVLDTMRHTVGGDASYLALLTGAVPEVDEENSALVELRSAMERHGPVWASFVAAELDPRRGRHPVPRRWLGEPRAARYRAAGDRRVGVRARLSEVPAAS